MEGKSKLYVLMCEGVTVMSDDYFAEELYEEWNK